MLILKTGENANDPTNQLPYIEKDLLIKRGATKVLIDVSHPDTFGGTDYTGVSIPSNTAVKNLVTGTADGFLGSTIPAGINGGAVLLPNSSLKVPIDKTDFNDTANIEKFAMIFWGAVPTSGYPNSAGTSFLLCGDSNTTNNRFAAISANFTGNSSAAQLNVIQFELGGTAFIVSSSTRDQFKGDTVKQLGFGFSKNGSTASADVYVDGELVETITVAFSENTNANLGGDFFHIGTNSVFNRDAQQIVKVGRASATDLTLSETSIEDYIKRDYDHARNFF